MKTGMMNMKKQSIFLSLTLAAALSFNSSTLFAKGDVDGGGGDARCAEYLDITAKVAIALKKIGQEKISKENPIIKADEIWNIRRAPLKCLPGKDLDRQARSYPDKKLTKLDVEKWEKMNRYEKIRLAMHELSVLARYEGDGEYFISDDIKNLLKENPNRLQMDMYGEFAKAIVKNKNGSITFFDPFFVINGKKLLLGRFREISLYTRTQVANAACKILTEPQQYKEPKAIHTNWAFTPTDYIEANRSIVILSREGAINEAIKVNRNSDVIESIVCVHKQIDTIPETVPQELLHFERAKHNGGGGGNTAEELNHNNADDTAPGVRAN